MNAPTPHVLLGRQAIFDQRKRVVGYELLFHAPGDAHGPTLPIDPAMMSDAVLSFGLDTLTNGIPTFVGVSPSLLLSGLPVALTPQQIVVEVEANIEASSEVFAALAALRARGYRIALDVRRSPAGAAELFAQAAFLRGDVAALRDTVGRPGSEMRAATSPMLIATGVDTVEDFDAAVALGCAAFQGEFISRPVLRPSTDIPANRLTYLRLLRALQDPDLSPRELEDLIKPDASLVFRTLRAVNSAAFAHHTRIESLRQALVLLGCDTVRKWASVWATTAMGTDVPDELVAMSTLRGRTCEIIASEDVTCELGDGFLLGMCSLLDAILEIPMPQILEHLPLPAETDAALRGEDNASRRLLNCLIAYERGDWKYYIALEAMAGLAPNAVPDAYRKALQWYAQIQPGNPVPHLLAQEAIWTA